MLVTTLTNTKGEHQMSYLDNITVETKRKHLNYEERKIIERLLFKKLAKSEIANTLCRDESTIKREIKRGTVTQRKRNPCQSKKLDCPEFIEYKMYFADVAQRKYEENRQNCGAKNKILACRELVEFVEGKVLGKEKWSIDTTIGYAKVNKLFENLCCTKTFYNWVDDNLTKVKNIDLLLKVRRKQNSPRKQRKKILGRSIDERPKAVDDRTEFGHWEGDGIVGKDHKGHLITLVERKLGIGIMFNVLDRMDDKIVTILDRLQVQFGEKFKEIFKSITFDNGSEFARSIEMERGGRTMIYYAHPYSSFERGTNENWNGIVRRFIPKGSSFDDLTENDILRITNYINTMPRKRLGYKSPQDLWNEEINAIMVS